MSEVVEGFRIDTPEQAAWAMRKYRKFAQRKKENEALAEAERVRVASWLERVNATVETEMEFFAGHLEIYAMKQRLQGRKSVDLPDGVIKTRSTAASVLVDKSTFVQWALESKRDDLLRVSYAPDLDAIKTTTVVDGGTVIDVASGEILPGVEPTPERVSVTIAPDLDATDLEGIEDEYND
jgi:hypothetical protein